MTGKPTFSASLVACIGILMLTSAAAQNTTPNSGGEVKCGFLTIQGLAIGKTAPKCETSSSAGSEGSTIEGAVLTLRVDPNNSYLRFAASKNTGGLGFKPMHSDQIRDNAERWVSKLSAKNWTALIGSPFPHFKFNMYDGGDWACVYGHTIGNKIGPRAGGHVHGVYVRYCERGTHEVSSERVSAIYRSMVFN